jgi:hypothetical protein
MSTLDLRPLSIGELLDRTFSLYRRNFLLFIGISAIPQLLVLALQLAQIAFTPSRVPVQPSATTDLPICSLKAERSSPSPSLLKKGDHNLPIARPGSR